MFTIINNRIKATLEILHIKDCQTKVCLCMLSIMKTNSAKAKPKRKTMANNQTNKQQKVVLKVTAKTLKNPHRKTPTP